MFGHLNILELLIHINMITNLIYQSLYVLHVKNICNITYNLTVWFLSHQAPINDDKAATTLIGLKPTTTKAHVVRAVLENLAFRVKVLYETILSETRIPLSHIR